MLLYDEYLDGQLDVVKLWNDGQGEVVVHGVNKNCWEWVGVEVWAIRGDA